MTLRSVPSNLQLERSKAPTASYTQTYTRCSSKHTLFFENMGTLGRRKRKLLRAKWVFLF